MGVCSPASVSSDGSPSGSSASLGAPPASTLQKAQPLQALLEMAVPADEGLLNSLPSASRYMIFPSSPAITSALYSSFLYLAISFDASRSHVRTESQLETQEMFIDRPPMAAVLSSRSMG